VRVGDRIEPQGSERPVDTLAPERLVTNAGVLAVEREDLRLEDVP
jgi:hypothetical protein